jgi:hypothetical protein
LYSTDGSCAPYLYDDSGTYKLLCGSISGHIYYYGNIDGNLTGNFNLLDTMVNFINDGPRSALQYIDINGDSKRDLIVGNYAGGLAFYSSKSPIGINELGEVESSIMIYPNPADEEFFVRADNLTEKLSVGIYDVTGKLCATRNSVSNSLKVNSSFLEKGLYFIRITTLVNNQNYTVTKKIVIQ